MYVCVLCFLFCILWRNLNFICWFGLFRVLCWIFSEKWKVFVITIAGITIFILLFPSAWFNWIFISTSTQWTRNQMSAIVLLKVATSWSSKYLSAISLTPRCTSLFMIVIPINLISCSSFFKILYFSFMLFFFGVVNEFSKFDLKPVHSPISFLYFGQRFFLISL